MSTSSLFHYCHCHIIHPGTTSKLITAHMSNLISSQASEESRVQRVGLRDAVILRAWILSVQAHRCEPRYHMGWIRIGESTDPYTVTCVIASCWILYMCEYDSYRFVQQLFEHVCAPLSCRFFVSSLHQFFVPVLSFNVVLYTSFSTLIPMGKTFVYRLIRAWQASINTRSFPPMKSTGGIVLIWWFTLLIEIHLLQDSFV